QRVAPARLLACDQDRVDVANESDVWQPGVGFRLCDCQGSRRVIIRQHTGLRHEENYTSSRPAERPSSPAGAARGARRRRKPTCGPGQVQRLVRRGYLAYRSAPRKCRDTEGSSPTTQLSCGSGGMENRSPGRNSTTRTPANAAVATPDTTRPACSTEHRRPP